MANDYAPRMSNESYFDFLERGAMSARPEDVRELRHEVMQRFRGDARADDLAEALYAHEVRLAESRSMSRISGRAGR